MVLTAWLVAGVLVSAAVLAAVATRVPALERPVRLAVTPLVVLVAVLVVADLGLVLRADACRPARQHGHPRRVRRGLGRADARAGAPTAAPGPRGRGRAGVAVGGRRRRCSLSRCASSGWCRPGERCAAPRVDRAPGAGRALRRVRRRRRGPVAGADLDPLRRGAAGVLALAGRRARLPRRHARAAPDHRRRPPGRVDGAGLRGGRRASWSARCRCCGPSCSPTRRCGRTTGSATASCRWCCPSPVSGGCGATPPSTGPTVLSDRQLIVMPPSTGSVCPVT